MELWEYCSRREVQGTLGGPPRLGSSSSRTKVRWAPGEASQPSLSQVGYFWDAGAGRKGPAAPLSDQSPP